MVKRIFLSCIILIIIFICCVSLCVPSKSYSYVINSKQDSIVRELSTADVVEFNNCSVNSDGNVTITGSDAYITLSCAGLSPFRSIALNIKSASSEDIGMQVYFDKGSGFNENDSIVAIIQGNRDFCAFPCVLDRLEYIRIDIDDPYIFKSIEFHSTDATLVQNEIKVNISVYLISLAVALITVVICLALDIKLNIFGKFLSFIMKSRIAILKGCLSFALCGFIAVIIEYLIGNFIFGPSSNGAVFNIYRFFLIFGILFSIAYLILCRKIAASKFENVFLGISITLCTTMVLVCPFGHASWDIDTHHKWVMNASYLGEVYVTQADTYVMSNNSAYWPSQIATENSKNIVEMNQAYKIFLYKNSGETTIAHRISGLFMSVARFFGASFYYMVTFAKMGNVLIYCYVCYFAIKKLKSGKMIATVIALIPTSLFLASNFSYDYWVNCFVLLGMAYFVGEQQEKEKPISVKNTIVMCLAFVLASIPKLIYALLLPIPFFMRKKKIQKPKVYYAICTLAIVVAIGMLVVKFLSQMSGGGDIRGGSDVSTVNQLRFLMAEPVHFARIIIRFLTEYLSVSGMVGYIANFAYLGMGTGASVWIILMFITALTDKNDYDIYAYNWISKCLVVVLYFGVAAAISLALYLEFTPVRLETVNGCQPRYIIPLLYPLLSIVGWGKFKNTIPKGIYSYSILIACCAVNFYNMATVMLPCWL